MTAPRNPCNPHNWQRLIIGGETIIGTYVDVHRCESCLEVRHTKPDADVATGTVTMPGHFKCVEHGRYNCAEEDRA